MVSGLNSHLDLEKKVKNERTMLKEGKGKLNHLKKNQVYACKTSKKKVGFTKKKIVIEKFWTR